MMRVTIIKNIYKLIVILKGGIVVTSDMALNIDQSLPLNSITKSNSSPQEEKWLVSTNAGSYSIKDGNPIPVDTVKISAQLQQALTDLKQEKALFKDTKQEESNPANSSNKSDRAAAKVEFVYDQKGDVITKYLDSASRLVYQTPSKFMLFLKDAAPKSVSSVDTEA